MNIDIFDIRLLKELQTDSRLTGAELAERVGLSASQCTRRRQHLEQQGVIAGYKAVIDPDKVGVDIFAFIQVTMDKHSRKNAEDFRRMINASPYTLDAWKLTGASDYLLRVAANDLADFNEFSEQLLEHPAISRLESQIVIERIKEHAPIDISG
jgi:DNA-binding Lrp family transcriptional regulator